MAIEVKSAGQAAAASSTAADVESGRLDLAVAALYELVNDLHALRLVASKAQLDDDVGVGAVLCAIAQSIEHLGLQGDLVLRHLGRAGVLDGPESWVLSPSQRQRVDTLQRASRLTVVQHGDEQ